MEKISRAELATELIFMGVVMLMAATKGQLMKKNPKSGTDKAYNKGVEEAMGTLARLMDQTKEEARKEEEESNGPIGTA